MSKKSKQECTRCNQPHSPLRQTRFKGAKTTQGGRERRTIVTGFICPKCRGELIAEDAVV